MNKIFVSVFYIGFSPVAPGTLGSLAGVLLGYIIQNTGGLPLLIIAVLVVFLAGWYFSHTYMLTRTLGKDPQEIVIDEVSGQLLSYVPISFYLWWFSYESYHSTILDWSIAFIFFRLFDIFKPWPINWADHIDSALGVMLDDLFAGLYSAILIGGIILYFL